MVREVGSKVSECKRVIETLLFFVLLLDFCVKVLVMEMGSNTFQFATLWQAHKKIHSEKIYVDFSMHVSRLIVYDSMVHVTPKAKYFYLLLVFTC